MQRAVKCGLLDSSPAESVGGSSGSGLVLSTERERGALNRREQNPTVRPKYSREGTRKGSEKKDQTAAKVGAALGARASAAPAARPAQRVRSVAAVKQA